MWYIRPGESGAVEAVVRATPSRTATRLARPSGPSPTMDGRDGSGAASPSFSPRGGGDDSFASISGSYRPSGLGGRGWWIVLTSGWEPGRGTGSVLRCIAGGGRTRCECSSEALPSESGGGTGAGGTGGRDGPRREAGDEPALRR